VAERGGRSYSLLMKALHRNKNDIRVGEKKEFSGSHADPKKKLIYKGEKGKKRGPKAALCRRMKKEVNVRRKFGGFKDKLHVMPKERHRLLAENSLQRKEESMEGKTKKRR